MAQQNIAAFKALLDTNITDNTTRQNTWDKVKALFTNLIDSQYNILDFVNLGPGNPIDATANPAFVALLKDDTNWDNTGAFTGTIPAAIKEGDYIVETGTDGTEWLYNNIGGSMYRALTKVLNAFLEGTLPDLASIDPADWNATGNVATAPLTGIAQGNLWLDQPNGLFYLSFKDGEITRFDFASLGGAMTAAAIIAAIDAEIGTDWKASQAASSLGLPGWEAVALGAGTLNSFVPNPAFTGGKLIGSGAAIPFTSVDPVAAPVLKRLITGDFTADIRIDGMVEDSSGSVVAGLHAFWAAYFGDAANAPFVSMAYIQDSPGAYLGRKSYRTAVGGAVQQDSDAGVGGTFPGGLYLRIVRVGNSITGFTSTDGATWVEVGTAIVDPALGDDCYLLVGASDGSGSNGCRINFTITNIS